MSRHRVQPPVDAARLSGRQAVLVLLSAGVLIATLFGYVAEHAGHPQNIPMDPGTPPAVTTLVPPR